MATPLTTLPLNPRDHWAFFHAAAPVSPADRQLIAVLDEDSALHVWDEVVGQPVPATVVVKHGWICDLSVPFVWQDAWNDRDDGWAGRVLRPALCWPDDEEVLFVERPRRALKSHFDVFLRAWRAFLIEDEGPLLVSRTKPQVAWFHPSGNGLLGERPGVVVHSR